MRSSLALAFLLLAAAPAVAETVRSAERTLSLPGALIEDAGPGVRYWSADSLAGRFDDTPGALRVHGTHVTFTRPEVTITCDPTPATTVRVEHGRVSQTTTPGTHGLTLWTTRTIAALTCTLNLRGHHAHAVPGTYTARRLTLRGDAP